ncbi:MULTISPECIES: cellulose biosynthesis cyclic di-GMP-binding regulatory protein BcsB [Alphaproteobacteria]|uniref:Cyclic di-GMP-binding protein n=2 Tax=Alphaproteobacteria TaxID=28211 RepID=A0A512HNJ1_9HYPH|nr:MULTISPECIES: cellulose biosynthesis cyclic di-GMP-binding regulatory protein BcsB [Alphaproteobacteria]GEO87011.1 cellulose synthase BcsB subunit [Ciceribacter naphthalenivorans]GLR21613.1 cellulose synthase BcsB subunit [Ciceribacter naphthalenivorans]GLT04469.1 cellulose synthase BcsB subunit [Sphingomonas psychrolutea]
MRRLLSVALISIWTPAIACAQVAPFDMSRERPVDVPPVRLPMTPTEPQPQPQSPPAPNALPPAAGARPLSHPQARRTGAAVETSSGTTTRYIAPFPQMTFEGEYDRKSWSVYLTQEEAASRAQLNIGYRNAVVVAPEASELSVFVNNQLVGQEAVGSPDAVSTIPFTIPPNLLQPGTNLLTLQSDLRHRTDCSIDSTYELWANVDATATYLSFDTADKFALPGTDAIRAVGLDQTGATQFDLVVPALEQSGTTQPLLRLVQGLALLSGMPGQRYSFTTASTPPDGQGRLRIFVGTAVELRSLLSALPTAVENGPLATFIAAPDGGAPVLLISGPSWQAISTAIDTLVSPVDRASTVLRATVMTKHWSEPEAPILFSDSRLTFAELGPKTIEFSGRRLRTGFNVAVPADFYANAYGQATILLDAAYSDAVLPGSHIDVYVNGQIASTEAITARDGGIFRHLPILVTMRHFKPGLNHIDIEANVTTQADITCAPGAPASRTARIAIFDTSEFHMPDFARIGQRPNLAAMSWLGFPYGEGALPTSLYMNRIDADMLSASATLLAKIAMAAGRPISLDITTSISSVGNHNAIFIGPISQLAPTLLSQLNISSSAVTEWRPAANVQATDADTGAIFDSWRSRVTGDSWRGRITAFQEWTLRNFDISLNSLQFIPQQPAIFEPSNSITTMIAQGVSPNGTAEWTLVTAPSAKDLRQGLNALTTIANWSDVSGRITTYSAETGKVQAITQTRLTFFGTQPWALANYRLIAANWLSTNILFYAFLLVVLALLVGVTTRWLLAVFGRQK